MTYWIFPLTREEMRQPNITGFNLIHNNQNRLIQCPDIIELNTYDKGTSLVVYNDTVYEIYKDYTDIINHKRIYLCRLVLNGNEQIG